MALKKIELDKFNVGMIDEDQLSRLEYPQGACIDCENVVFMPTGAVAKRKGYEKLHTTAWKNAAIIKTTQWKTVAGIEYSLVFSAVSGAASAGIAYVDTSGLAAVYHEITLDSGQGAASGTWAPASGDAVTCVSYAGSAVMTHTGADGAPLVWDSTTLTATHHLNEAPSGSKTLVAWGNYLFLGNMLSGAVRLGSRVQWCYPLNPTNWPTANFIDLDPDDGDEITCMVNFGAKIVVFKRYKTFVLSWVGGRLQFQEQRVSTSVGCAGPNAWMDLGDCLYFIGDYTAYKFDGKSDPKAISDKIQSSWNNINMPMGYIFQVDADDENWQIWFLLCYGPGQTTNNRIWVYDTRFESWSKFSIPASCIGSISYGASMLYAHLPAAYSTYTWPIQDATGASEGIILFGLYTGFLCKYGTVEDDIGVAITGYWTSRWLTFDAPDRNKRITRLTCFIERYGDYDLNIDLYKDWNIVTPVQQKTMSLSGSVDVPMIERRSEFTQQLRAAQFKFSTTASNSPFILHKMIIEFVPKGKKIVE